MSGYTRCRALEMLTKKAQQYTLITIKKSKFVIVKTVPMVYFEENHEYEYTYKLEAK